MEKIFEPGQFIYTLKDGKIDRQRIWTRKSTYVESWHIEHGIRKIGPLYTYSIDPFVHAPIDTDKWFGSQEELFESIKYVPVDLESLVTPRRNHKRRQQ